MFLCRRRKPSGRSIEQHPYAAARRRIPEPSSAVSNGLDESAFFDPSISRISMAELLAATKHFAAEGIIGDGSFGFVYKARLNNGVTVAVKKLNREAFQGFREFRAEMETLGRIRHSNLVKMLGYCVAGEDRVLIYEFVARGSLDQWLYDTSSSRSGQPQSLDWKLRKKIVKGIASGLCYLHEGCEPRIIHRDIKASNVLLDPDFEAKIADFGLARRMDGSHSHVSTQVAGTMGYMPPEYRDGVTIATVKADVYSFGILMVEVATGKPPNWPIKVEGEKGKEVCLIVWARRMVEAGKHMEMVDSSILPEKVDSEVETEVKEYLRIAYRCTSESSKDRPTMGEAVAMLNAL